MKTRGNGATSLQFTFVKFASSPGDRGEALHPLKPPFGVRICLRLFQIVRLVSGVHRLGVGVLDSHDPRIFLAASTLAMWLGCAAAYLALPVRHPLCPHRSQHSAVQS
eukprot:1177324-Prorocentrum_minimum.AAC.2